MRTYRFNQVGENEMIVFNPASLLSSGAGKLANLATTYVLGKIGGALFPDSKKEKEKTALPKYETANQTVYNPTPSGLSFDMNTQRANGLGLSGAVYENGVRAVESKGKSLGYTPPTRRNRVHIAN